jgi:hypothetical protein
MSQGDEILIAYAMNQLTTRAPGKTVTARYSEISSLTGQYDNRQA